jgi:hypothetical protein
MMSLRVCICVCMSVLVSFDALIMYASFSDHAKALQELYKTVTLELIVILNLAYFLFLRVAAKGARDNV